MNPWDDFYNKHQQKMYQDRHWLWQIFPEVFPLPPGRSYAECYSQICSCHVCGPLPLDQLPCPHSPVYRSQFVQTEQFQQLQDSAKPELPDSAQKLKTKGLEVPFAPRDFSRQQLAVLEVGSGAGATVFPLLEKNAEVTVTCGDFSDSANAVLAARPRFDSAVMTLQKMDVTAANFGVKGELAQKERFDFAIVIFVISAVPVDKIMVSLRNLLNALKPGGTLLFFDYAEGDFREEKRLQRGERFEETWAGRLFNRQLEDTPVVFFNERFVKEVEQEFAAVEVLQHEKMEENAKSGQKWVKKYLLLKIRKPQ